MAGRYAVGKRANALCDRCGQPYKLNKLKEITVNDSRTNLLVCTSCWEPEHPQNKQGKYLVDDPQALREPRPDASELVASRNIQYGWRPVGIVGLNSTLQVTSAIGTVTITTS